MIKIDGKRQNSTHPLQRRIEEKQTFCKAKGLCGGIICQSSRRESGCTDRYAYSLKAEMREAADVLHQSCIHMA